VGPPSRLQTQSHLRLRQVAFVVYVTSRQPMVASRLTIQLLQFGEASQEAFDSLPLEGHSHLLVSPRDFALDHDAFPE